MSYDAPRRRHKVPIFTLDQVVEITERGYDSGYSDGSDFEVGIPPIGWEMSPIKVELDAIIAAQAAGGE